MGDVPAILQPEIPADLRMAAARNLPGIQPLNQKDWLTVDTAYAAQMAERARLMAHRRDAVLACRPEAETPARELLDEVLVLLKARSDFDVHRTYVIRPDGVDVPLDRPDPLETLAHLITEDLCLLQKKNGAHELTAAVLCFPASWTLAEKIGKPLIGVHDPVPDYDTGLAQRVQRLFDGVKPGQPIWRANLLRYEDPALFQPRPESDLRNMASKQARFERSERQVLWRLPNSRAVVFTIHTTVARATEKGTRDQPET
jgi:hypothetical protein